MSEASPEPKRFPPMRLLKIGVSVVLLAVIAVAIARTDGIAELPSRLASIDPLALVLAIGLQFGAVIVGVERWRRLLVWQRLERPFGELVRVFLVGRFVGAFTPGTTGLDVTRAIAIGRRTGEMAKSTTAIAVEKVFGLLGLALGAIITLPLGAARFFGEGAHAMAFGAALGSVALLGLVLRPKRLFGIARFLPKGPRTKAEAIAERLDAEPPTFPELVLMGVLATLSHMLTAACYAASGVALHVEASIGELIVVGFAIVAATLLPISAGGAGVREGTAVLLLHAIGIPTGEAVLVALLGYLATQPPAIVGGLVQAFGEPASPA